MDNHPIPQDVTGFQFKLIGNMTVKQFAYLATGVILAGIVYKLPINILIKFPFCLFSALLGTGLAYFPVSGRPMDLMIGNYIKALLRPTQFLYEKTGGQIYFPNKTQFTSVKRIKQYKIGFNPLPKDKLKVYLESLNAKPKNKADEKENNFLMSVSGLATGNTQRQDQELMQQVYAAPQPVAATQPASPKPQQNVPVTPDAQLVKPKTTMSAPRKGFNRNIGTPDIPTSPNLITGITKDARGNDLSNILIEIKDKDGNPVRAFKTNEFGRFASATPLMNGTYTVEFEDPKGQNRFGKITINVTGQIILPIEAISIDMREELRKSLFPTN